MSRSYWLGPALGATVAAGFYKFIKYLEYETVLGPEDGDAPAPSRGPAQGSMLSGGAPAMTGPNVAAGKMYEDASASKGPTMAIQGAGLGDLLTHGAPSNVSCRGIDSPIFGWFIVLDVMTETLSGFAGLRHER